MSEPVEREGDHIDVPAAPAAPAKAAAKRTAKGRGGRPNGSRTKHVDPAIALRSPEVQAVIAEAVASATAKLTAQLAEARSKHGTEDASGDVDWSRRLAMSIAELSDQDNRRKRVPPAVMEKRRLAFDRMMQLIVDYRAQDVMPEYELTRAVYLNEELVAPTYTDRDHVLRRTRIEWYDVPNEGMSPVNESARAIFTEFMGWIGGPTPNVTKLSDAISEKKPHTGLKVLHKNEVDTTAQVAVKRSAGVTKLGRRQAGDVIETHVLGSVADPARQIA